MGRTLAGCRRAARRLSRGACAALCVAPLIPSALAHSTGGSQGAVRLTSSEVRYYETAKPFTTWSSQQLLHAKLGLKGLKFAESQKRLPAILERTGDNVRTFFRNFTNTESVETIVETHLNPVTGRGGFAPSQEQKFNYLFLATPSGESAGIDEYRTDSKGRRVEPQHLLPGASFVTEGFASLPALFLPARQPESTFRYLGDQQLDKRKTLVVAFAQQPRTARWVGTFKSGADSVVLLLQGIAWIALPDYQIIRLRSDLLAPRADIGLEQETTDIRLKDVHFRRNGSALWLPVDVNVTIGWQGNVFQNHHHYAGFKVFEVQTLDQVSTRGKKSR